MKVINIKFWLKSFQHLIMNESYQHLTMDESYQHLIMEESYKRTSDYGRKL